MYVLVRTDGKYVAAPGSQHSYTAKLENARIFPTKDAADANRCVGNEVTTPISSLLRE